MTALRAHSDRYTSKPVDYRNYIDGASLAAGWPTGRSAITTSRR